LITKESKSNPIQSPEKVDPNNANIAAAELKLGRRLGSPVKIKFTGKGGQIEIKFSSSDELTRIFELLIRENA
jgi:hypothetical protein